MIAIQVLVTLALALLCLAWLAVLPLSFRARQRLPRLVDRILPAVGRWPTVSVVLAVRDDARALYATCESLLDLEYEGLEIILVDDRSRTDTRKLVDQLAERDPRMRCLHLSTLPQGWLGRNHALHVGTSQARGEWVLLTEAGVRFENGALRQTMRWISQQGLDQVTLYPDTRTKGFLATAMEAVATRMAFLGLRVWAVGESSRGAYAGVSAFHMIRRETLGKCGGLEYVNLDFAADLALGKALREAGARSSLAMGTGLVSVPGHPDVRAVAEETERKAYALMGFRLSRLLAAGALFGALELAPWIALLSWSIPALQWLGAIAATCQLVTAAGVARHTGRPVLPALAAPVGVALHQRAWYRSGIVGTRAGGAHSREMFFPAERLRLAGTVELPEQWLASLVDVREQLARVSQAIAKPTRGG